MNFLIAKITLLFCLVNVTAHAFAQKVVTPTEELPVSLTEQISNSEDDQRSEEAVIQLNEIELSLRSKISERRQLRLALNKASDTKKASIEKELEGLNSEIVLLEKTFEQIAIGGVDLSVFGVDEEKFDWREELVTIVKPLIENVKSLTEKPRKIENLRRVISEKNLARETAKEAIASIEQLVDEAESKQVSKKLGLTLEDWLGRLEDLNREIQLAEYQLDSLEGKDVPWVQILKRSFYDFIEGRGLTLVFIIGIALAVLALMRLLLWLVRKRVAGGSDNSGKTHYRLAAYGYRLLTGLLIAVGIMMVLYFRQDLLLLAVMVVVFIGFALALKNLLPKYVAEGRILLNMGGIRERERVIYRGIPWEVASINVHSRFVNPQLRGGVRLPISHMHEMVSRPSNDELWFPSSEGDWIIGDDGNPEKVLMQTVDTVVLEDLNAVSHTMPTAAYFERGFPNISRSKVFRIAVSFGIDYATQSENPEVIENAFTKGIVKAFHNTEYAEYVQDIAAEFKEAGDSSLNYLILTKFDSEAARYYNRIKRRIQRACVTVCNENDWGIPFPQITVHHPANMETEQGHQSQEQDS